MFGCTERKWKYSFTLGLLLLASIWDSGSPGLQAQESGSSTEAVAAVRRSIQAMGGATQWAAVGAATAKVAISADGAATRQVAWSDDWSTGHNRYRRELSSSSSTLSIVGDSHARSMHLGNGKINSLPRSNDIVVLAVGYPASALLLSLQRPECTFRMAAPTDEQDQASSTAQILVIEDCSGTAYPPVELKWTLATSSGLPIQVDLPIQSIGGHGVFREQVQYKSYTQNQALVYPSIVDVTKPGGYREEFTISESEFHSSLPDQLFDLTR